MKKKRLPTTSPIITTYPAETTNLTIAAQHNDFNAWVFNNNIQLMLSNDLVNAKNRFSMLELFPFGCPLVTRTTLPEKLNCNDDIISRIELYINNKMYVMVEVDAFYIPASSLYSNQHGWASILIYGYNNETTTLYAAGFFSNSKYEFIEIPYNILCIAYSRVTTVADKKLFKSNDSICLFTLRSEFNYRFDIDCLLEAIEDYLYATAPKGYLFKACLDIRSVSEFSFGMDVYELLLLYTSRLSENANVELDLRLFHVLYQHKLLWIKRIQYMNSQGYLKKESLCKLDDMSTQMGTQSNVIRELAIKQNLVHKKEIIQSIYEDLLLLKDLDYKFHTCILDAICPKR